MTHTDLTETLAALVRDFLDPDPCQLDHHGYCQAHSWLCEGRCPHARAREVLAEVDAVSAAVAPPTQAALRDRIAQALAREDAHNAGYDHGFVGSYGADDETDGFVDAVLAVLPEVADWDALVREADRLRRDGKTLHARAEEIDNQLTALRQQITKPADRDAVLREVADELTRKANKLTERVHDLAYFVAKDRLREAEILDREATALRRMADETATETPAPTHGEAAFTALMAVPAPALVTVHLPGQPPLVGTWHGGGTGTPRGSADLVWEPTITFPRQPAAGARQDKPTVTVHAVPMPGSNGISACCGRPPCEFVGERVTRDPDKVTCPGPAAGAPHTCDNCDGIDPDTCFNNPNRPPEQCPAAEFEDYGQQCQKPAGHNLHSFEEQPAAGARQDGAET
ncbi:hypothetical protein ABT320_09770 [Streptomyces cellulosae]